MYPLLSIVGRRGERIRASATASDVLEIDISKTQSDVPASEHTLIVQVGGSDVAEARWHLNASTLPRWLHAPVTAGLITREQSSAAIALSAHPTGVPSLLTEYLAKVTSLSLRRLHRCMPSALFTAIRGIC